jgi:putative DNA modification/repair radical SAM protein
VSILVAIVACPDYLLNEKDVYDINQNLKYQIKEEVKEYASYEELPERFVQAITSAEDKRFWYHPGFDPIAIGNAIYVDIKKKKFVLGGSTITQQLSKNLFLNPQKKIERKLKEVLISVRLELNYTKEDILEMYSNVIYYGNGATGIKNAAIKYFGKNLSELNISECAILAGLPKSPNRYNPIKNYKLAIKRRNKVLELMAKNGHITNIELDKLKKEPIAIKTTSYCEVVFFLQTFVRYDNIKIKNKRSGVTMDIFDKLKILANAAKYDVSCSSSGSNRKNDGGLGNAVSHGICHSFAADGRCISLLKILLSNKCIYDCKYCVNRASNETARASFEVDEIVKLTMNFYKRNYIEGLFLSSGVEVSPDYTMERMVSVVERLRKIENFNGYIHIKAIPGAKVELIRKAGFLADRMSSNIELPSQESLNLLAPQKEMRELIQPMQWIGKALVQNGIERKKYKSTPRFVPGGQSTQMIVGASSESDRHIVSLSENLYKTENLKRVYYSAYMPINKDPLLPALGGPPLLREHRLYQADWLLRFYGFKANEILTESSPNLDLEIDPKANWALNHLDKFPIEINQAPYEILLKIPGIGPKSALKIIKSRRVHYLDYDDLKRMHVVLKRAKYFITCKGKFFGDYKMQREWIRMNLVDKQTYMKFQQLNFFDQIDRRS